MRKLNLRFRLMIFFALISLAVFTAAGVLSWKECREKSTSFSILTRLPWRANCQ